MTKRQLEKYAAHVGTMYKRKDKKKLPANVPLPDCVNPGGGVNLGDKIGDLNSRLNASQICKSAQISYQKLKNNSLSTSYSRTKALSRLTI